MSQTTQLSLLPPENVRVAADAVVQFRRAHGAGDGAAVTHVLLHGIGSASASWLAQLQQATETDWPAHHLVAWDAPGYGASTALPMEAPRAADYAARMWHWLDALEVDQPITLVGHSLGALIAASAAVSAPGRVARLVLLAPAPGYAHASAALRDKKLADRLANLATHGPAGMARARAGAMLSASADAAQVAFIEHVMAQIDPAGYTQAAKMLAGGDLAADLRQVSCPMIVASGDADTITPAQACQELARQAGADYVSLGAAGHACALEAARQVNRLLGLQGMAA
jgi:pimeloyl-ACP methyl ester carboxylesterase